MRAVLYIQALSELNLPNKDKIILSFNQTLGASEYSMSSAARKMELDATPELSEGEYSTLIKMKDYCDTKTRAGEKAFVYYFRPMAQCCMRHYNTEGHPSLGTNPQASWREELNAFTLEYPSICLRALLHGYSTCGVDLISARYT